MFKILSLVLIATAATANVAYSKEILATKTVYEVRDRSNKGCQFHFTLESAISAANGHNSHYEGGGSVVVRGFRNYAIP